MTLPAACTTTACFSVSRFTGKERDDELRNHSFQFDTLNRLITGDGAEHTYHGQSILGGYDAIGNRPAQSRQSSVWSTPGSS
jgi:hypothetical protein